MGVTVVVGGQFGSEGKGKVAHHFAKEFGVQVAVKVGGVNAGHTAVDVEGRPHVFRVLPTAALLPDVVCVISPGSYFPAKLLFEEIEALHFDTSRLRVSGLAAIISEEMHQDEKASGLVERIGSTGTGTGEAVLKRIRGDADLKLARDIPELQPWICDTTDYMRGMLDNGAEILIEGTQGFGLSVLHTPYYPYCTSRDTTASAFVMEAGLSPLDVTHVVQVLRSYPIRVGGNSGPLPRETDWDTVTRLAHSPKKIIEMTSVTHRVRRVAKFDPDIVAQSTCVNKPDITVLNFLDYIWEPNGEPVGPVRQSFIDYIERSTGCKITHVGLDATSVIPV